jgi:hypothetical protein
MTSLQEFFGSKKSETQVLAEQLQRNHLGVDYRTLQTAYLIF